MFKDITGVYTGCHGPARESYSRADLAAKAARFKEAGEKAGLSLEEQDAALLEFLNKRNEVSD